MNSITNIDTNTVQGFMEDLSLLRIPPWWQNPWVIAAAVLLLAIAILIGRRFYLRWQMRPKTVSAINAHPGEPPHHLALRRLADLRQRLPGMSAYDFNIECSQILRSYIGARFEFPILFQTTREFLQHVHDSPSLDEPSRLTLGQYLHASDAVKFGRREMSEQRMGEGLSYAEEFVRKTAPAEAVAR